MTKKQADYLSLGGFTLVGVIVLTCMWFTCPKIEAGVFTGVVGTALAFYWAVIIFIHWGKPWGDGE